MKLADGERDDDRYKFVGGQKGIIVKGKRSTIRVEGIKLGVR